jgi:hypothetical protein
MYRTEWKIVLQKKCADYYSCFEGVVEMASKIKISIAVIGAATLSVIAIPRTAKLFAAVERTKFDEALIN